MTFPLGPALADITGAYLVVLDGWGIAAAGPGNAIAQAQTPNVDALHGACAHSALQASGRAVGLPDGQMGNSEVGHLTSAPGRRCRRR